MKDTLARDFARLAQRIQENATDEPHTIDNWPEEMGLLFVSIPTSSRGFVVQPFSADQEQHVLNGMAPFRPIADIEGLLKINQDIVAEFNGEEYWALHLYVKTIKLLVEDGYGVHLFDGPEDAYDYVPPVIFVDLKSSVPIVSIQEVDVEEFTKLLNGTIDLDNLPADSVKH